MVFMRFVWTRHGLKKIMDQVNSLTSYEVTWVDIDTGFFGLRYLVCVTLKKKEEGTHDRD